MIRFLVLSLLAICFSCGGILPDKGTARRPAGLSSSLPLEKRLSLAILERKYSERGDKLKVTIVRGMILELEEKHPGLQHALPASEAKVDDLPAFRSLELTVEHRAHLESVKIHSRHSAFHAVP